jgi:hypothetical protein
MPKGIKKGLSRNKLEKTIKKKQIILCNTTRGVQFYLDSLLLRKNGKYDRQPHYVVSKEGVIHKILTDEEISGYFTNNDLKNNSIVIALENNGWLEKIPLKDEYTNWIGDIYKGDIYEKKWRDYIYWEPYPKELLIGLSDLCKTICENLNINKELIGHNTKIVGAEKFLGILCKSNISEYYLDVSPAFNFELFEKLLNDE